MTLPAAGWFPDPQDRAKLRWWDGRTWGGQTQPAPRELALEADRYAAQEPATAAPSFSVGNVGPGGSLAASTTRAWAYGAGIVPGSAVRWFCVWAWGAIMFASASVFMNPYGVLSILGVVFGVIGLVHPTGTGRWRAAGRSVAISALVLGVATGFIAAVPLLGGFGALAHLL